MNERSMQERGSPEDTRDEAIDRGAGAEPGIVVGLDLGDKHSELCFVERAGGDVLERSRIRTTPAAMRLRFGSSEPLLAVLEVGAHSPWVSELLSGVGHETLVANPRRVALIYRSKKKNDKVDAESLARLGRLDPKLLSPIRHRRERARSDLAVLRARDALVRTRTLLINHCRGAVKPMGGRLPSCSSRGFAGRVQADLPESLRPALLPMLGLVEQINLEIAAYDQKLEVLATESYPETALLTAIRGVGNLTALAFILTLEDPDRFRSSRSVGSYLGLAPGQDESGDSSPQKGITKEGDGMVRRLLVQCAHYMMGPLGEDSDLKRHGVKLAERGGVNARKRAAVAVARKLAVLMHRLWSRGEVYDPLFTANKTAQSNDATEAVGATAP